MDLQVTGVSFDDGKIIERRSQDVSPILEHAHNLRAVGEIGGSEMRHAAKLPKALIENYCAEKGISFHEWMANPVHVQSMLNDPALAGFRIWQGRV